MSDFSNSSLALRSTCLYSAKLGRHTTLQTTRWAILLHDQPTRMDRMQKKVLDENLQFLQENLVLTETFYAFLIQNGIFSDDMVQNIQIQATPHARNLELLQLLKKRNTGSFDQFIEILRMTSQGHLADQLHQSMVDKFMAPSNSAATERVKEFIHKNYIQKLKFSHSDMRLAVESLVLRNDLITEQEEKETILKQCVKLQEIIQKKDEEQQDIRARLDFHLQDNEEHLDKIRGLEEELRVTRRRVSSGKGGLHRSISQSSEHTFLRSSPDEGMRNMFKQKEELLRKKDEEYNDLRNILEATQNDLQSVLDLNNQYLVIISQLNQLQVSRVAKTKVEHEDTSDLELHLEESQAKVIELHSTLDLANEKLGTKRDELDDVLEREIKYKQMLGLDEDASERQVVGCIMDMKEGGIMRRKELEKVKQELVVTLRSKTHLEEQLTSVQREKEQVEFHLRQQNLTIKKMMRMKTARDAIHDAEAVLGAKVTLNKSLFPALSPTTVEVSPSTQLRLQSVDLSRALLNQYCVLCRTEINSMQQASQACRIHHKALRQGKWQCCRDDCHRSAGCLHGSHYFVEITRDKRLLLTNTVNSIFLS